MFKLCFFLCRFRHWFQTYCGWTQRKDTEPLVENHLCISRVYLTGCSEFCSFWSDLCLDWHVIELSVKVEVVLDEDQLREEIAFLKRTSQTKRRLESLRADRGLQPSPVKTRAPYEHGSTKITLLMDWVRAVCDFYSLKVKLCMCGASWWYSCCFPDRKSSWFI